MVNPDMRPIKTAGKYNFDAEVNSQEYPPDFV